MTVHAKQYIDFIMFCQLQQPYIGPLCKQEYVTVYCHFNRKKKMNPLGPFCGIKNVFSVFSSHFKNNFELYLVVYTD